MKLSLTHIDVSFVCMGVRLFDFDFVKRSGLSLNLHVASGYVPANRITVHVRLRLVGTASDSNCGFIRAIARVSFTDLIGKGSCLGSEFVFDCSVVVSRSDHNSIP